MDWLIQFLNYAPHKMVLVSMISVSVLLFVVLLYKTLLPSKYINYFYLILAFSVLPLISIFRSGSYESGDLTINAAKLMSFYANLAEGNIIPRWSGELNATYGYPNFIFAYPAPYYIASLFHFFGFSFINSIKALLILSYSASGIVMFSWLRKKIINEQAAFLGSIIYLYSPYRLVDMHFRVDIGETLAFVFMPLSLFLIDKSIEHSKFIWQFVAGLSIALLILSHQAVSLLFFPLLIFYVFIYKKKNYLPIVLGLFYSSYYWIPVIFETKLTQQVIQINNQIIIPQFWELVYSPFRGGFLFQGPMGELSPVIGHAGLLSLMLYFYLLIKKELIKHLTTLRFVQ